MMIEDVAFEIKIAYLIKAPIDSNAKWLNFGLLGFFDIISMTFVRRIKISLAKGTTSSRQVTRTRIIAFRRKKIEFKNQYSFS